MVSFLAGFSATVQASSCSTNHPEIPTTSLVPCGQYPDCRCELTDLFVMLERIYIFILRYMAAPLAGLLIVGGGVCILLSGLNPKFYDTGKTMLWGAFWGVALMLTSYIIVDVIMRALGYTGLWSSF